MSKIIRYAIYEGRIFFRIKVAVFYSVLFPLCLLFLYYFSGELADINAYFPYLISVTLISTTGGLSSLIVSNRIYNMWKFYSFYGYKTWHMAVATGIIYFLLSGVICILMSLIMIFVFKAIEISFFVFLKFLLTIGIGTIFYIEIAIVIGLAVSDPRNAQTIISGFIYLFVILSGSIIRFEQTSILGKIMALFPNIHLGNLLYSIWNGIPADMFSVIVLTVYMVIFAVVIVVLLNRERKKLLY